MVASSSDQGLEHAACGSDPVVESDRSWLRGSQPNLQWQRGAALVSMGTGLLPYRLMSALLQHLHVMSHHSSPAC
jgi:hypothetical protein